MDFEFGSADWLKKELEDNRQSWMARLAKEGNVEFGFKKCVDCGHVVEFDSDFACDCEKKRELAIAKKRRKEDLRSAYLSIPKELDWARREEPRLKALEKLHPLARQIVRWSRRSGEVSGNVILSGPTGCGKTICCVVLLHKILDHATDNELNSADLEFARKVRFISALDLITSRRDSSLGSEPEELREAKKASLLILDELGHEAYAQDRDSTLFELVDHRYREGYPTIVTTGRNEADFRTKYGAALMRRLTHGGLGFVSMWEETKPV